MDYCERCSVESSRSEYVQCCYCRQWSHCKCNGLSVSDVKSWNSRLKFACRSCAYEADGTYDLSAALCRLTVVRLSARKTALVNQALSEQKLLSVYNVTVPKKATDNSEQCSVDPVAKMIIEMYNPSLSGELSPLKTGGDGNCLYRAVSLVLTGSENFHILLRLLTAIELILHQKCYDTGKKYNDFLNDTRIVTCDYQKLLTDTLQLNSFSQTAHVVALSAATGLPVRTYFPNQIGNELADALNRVWYGRGVDQSESEPEIKIMWTSTHVPNQKHELRVNHFVALVYNNLTSELCVEDRADESHELPSVSMSENELSDCADLAESNPENASTDMLDTSSTSNATDNESVLTKDETSGPLTGFMPTDQVIDLLTRDIDGLDELPKGVKENVYFVVKNDHNVTVRQTRKRSDFPDDCGIWDGGKGTSPKTYYVKFLTTYRQTWLKDDLFCYRKKTKGQVSFIPYDPQPDSTMIFPVQRYYATLKKDNTYKKRVTWLQRGCQGRNLAVIEYVGVFPGLGHHGNSKRGTEYIRLAPTVMDEITDLTGKMKPHQILNTLTDKYDELTQPSSLRQVHDKQYRDRQKDRHIDGHHDNFADQIRYIESQVSEKHDFIRTVIRTGGRTPSIILYTDEQMDDLKSVCCQGQAVLGVDKTFNLCKMHVTVTCFKQTTVQQYQTGQHPIFLGPIFIHDNSDFETYSDFFYQIRKKLHDTPLSKLVIGSDDEKALVKAIETIFPDSTHTLCTRHLEENVRHKLTDDAVTKKQRTQVMDRIFGDEGMTNADDTICYDEMVNDIEKDLAQVSSKFQDYFKKRLVPILKSKVNDPQRENKVIKHWTNNNCESMNHVLKQTVDWKSQSLPDLIRLIHDLVKGQYKRLRSALLQTGDYRLAETHRQFEKTKTEWLRMTDKQRSNHFRRYRQFVHKDEKLVTSTDGKSTVVPPKTNGRKPGQIKRKPKTQSLSLKRQKTVD